jgi:hypothetical protein
MHGSRASFLSARVLLRSLIFMLLATGAAQQAAAGPYFVRPSIATLTPAQITSLRAGFKAMEGRLFPDPTGLAYQAAIHGTYMATMDPILKQCQHGSYLFLAWHRMYLYYFERILRKASGDPTLTLPYWNYEDPTQLALPAIYRLPANTATNSLYTPLRDPNINTGTWTLRPSDVDDGVAMSDLNFDSPMGSGASFGGQIMPGPVHFNGPHGELESQPHDLVHMRIGGATGLMSDPNTAAQDPIFWVHHANIDRLWKRWLAQGGGRSDPLLDQVWMTTNFTFYDENKNPVTLSGSQVIDTLSQLGYIYDDDPVPVLPIIPYAVYFPSQWPVPQPPCDCPYLLELNIQQILTQQVTVELPLNSATLAAISQVLSNSPSAPPLSLQVGGIQSSAPPGVTFEIYLNLPSGGSNAQFGSPSYLGNLALFGFSGEHSPPSGGVAGFRLNTALKNLQAAGLWNGQTLSVTFISRGPMPPAGQPDTSPTPAGTQSFSSLGIVNEQ